MHAVTLTTRFWLAQSLLVHLLNRETPSNARDLYTGKGCLWTKLHHLPRGSTERLWLHCTYNPHAIINSLEVER